MVYFWDIRKCIYVSKVLLYCASVFNDRQFSNAFFLSPGAYIFKFGIKFEKFDGQNFEFRIPPYMKIQKIGPKFQSQLCQNIFQKNKMYTCWCEKSRMTSFWVQKHGHSKGLLLRVSMWVTLYVCCELINCCLLLWYYLVLRYIHM